MCSPYAYNTSHPSRGKCVIVNNKKFDDSESMPYRNGAQKDEKELLVIFKKLGFDVDTHLNLTAKEMLRLMGDSRS